jgi:signal transduction histidine kinase
MAEESLSQRLLRLNMSARRMMATPSLDVLLQEVVDEARVITEADFSALLVLKEGSRTEVAKFVYNAPRELFPDRLPRAIGLLAAVIETGAPARIDDIRAHPQALGIPVEHPPIGPLLAVPLASDGSVFGELAVANAPENRKFDDADETVLSELGQNAAHAIRLIQATEERVARDEARQTMLDLLRHDMMTPIATAKGAIELLSGEIKLDDQQRRRLMSAMSRAVLNLEGMAKNLRSDARLDAPQLEGEIRDIDTAALLDDLADDLGRMAADRDIDLSVNKEDAPEQFRGVESLARQAIENLVTNAIKISSNGGRVAITARAEGPSVRFDVTDQGPGIGPEDQRRLFDRFGKSTHSSPGLGLGLSIVKRVAEAHGGAVGVASQPGHGSTFWISLPVTGPSRD